MQGIAAVDPPTRCTRSSVCRSRTRFGAIAGDVLYLLVFSAIALTAATALFKRTL
jgi:hypothetical protein